MLPMKAPIILAIISRNSKYLLGKNEYCTISIEIPSKMAILILQNEIFEYFLFMSYPQFKKITKTAYTPKWATLSTAIISQIVGGKLMPPIVETIQIKIPQRIAG